MLFVVASFLCGAAHSLVELVAFRVIQGIGGGALLATAQATLFEAFPPEEIGIGQAIFGVGEMVGPTIGPTLGGWIVDNYQWPWIF
jgi:DHA2 family multidrug resistance protein